jgi:glycosylphosphatidylinositol transamidase (GPIT) subunit GPI8
MMRKERVVDSVGHVHMEVIVAAYDRLSTKQLLELKHAKQAKVLTLRDLKDKFNKEHSHEYGT